MALGRLEEGVVELTQAIDIARAISNADDVGRGHNNLISALAYGGELERGAEAVEAGLRDAEAYGITSTYGTFFGHNAIHIETELGQWDRAMERARDLDIVHATLPASRYGLARWLPLLVARGEGSLPRAQVERMGELLHGTPVEGQFHGAYYVARAELALWEGRPDVALAGVEDAIAALGDIEWTWYHIRLFRYGAWAAADVAEVARARRDTAGEERAVARAGALRVQRERLLERLLAMQTGAQAADTAAESVTADAEDLRLVGELDPAVWRDVVERWQARRKPYPTAYSLARLAEALAGAGDRAAATEALREAEAIARELGARPLRAVIVSLAARARLSLEGVPEASPEQPAPTDPYGLTRREREVLALVSLGRTNRQIGDELFISENTAGVHVSNILGKLGVASRTEAAAIAVRAGLAPEPLVEEGV
jgi:ATP/maltotriose-dependent transcriptional regulator MalT